MTKVKRFLLSSNQVFTSGSINLFTSRLITHFGSNFLKILQIWEAKLVNKQVNTQILFTDTWRFYVILKCTWKIWSAVNWLQAGHSKSRWRFILWFYAIRKSPQNRSAIPPLFIGPYAAANNTALLAWKPSQGTKLYCLVNRGTLGVNNLPRVVARIMLQSELNPRPLDHESNAVPLHHRVTFIILHHYHNHWLSLNSHQLDRVC